MRGATAHGFWWRGLIANKDRTARQFRVGLFAGVGAGILRLNS